MERIGNPFTRTCTRPCTSVNESSIRYVGEAGISVVSLPEADVVNEFDVSEWDLPHPVAIPARTRKNARVLTVVLVRMRI